MRRSFKYRLFTNANQDRELAIMLETHRRLYNKCLDVKQLAWECYKTNVSFFDFSKWLTIERKTNPYLARINAKSAELTVRRIEKVYQAFFNRGGFPRFKSFDRFSSFTFSVDSGGCKIIGGKLRIQHVGSVRIKVHRPHEGQIKTIAIKREANRWYAVLSCDLGERMVSRNTNPPIGIDLGLKEFVTTSDGESLGDTKNLDRALPELRRRQRALARCRRGSNTRKIVKLRLTRLYATVSNRRRDTHHKVAKFLVDRYGLIAVESLNVLGMLKNRRLSRRISDAGWCQFITILTSKAESAGSRVVPIDPRHTSQLCSACGRIVRKDLKVRVHKCECGCELDRDHNAALNVLARAAPHDLNVGNSLRGHKSRHSLMV